MESKTAAVVGEKRERSHDQEDLGNCFGFKCNTFHGGAGEHFQTLLRSPGTGMGGGGGSGVSMAMTSTFPFTAAQWVELQRQALIYKHIIASVPVPYYLLFPISNFEAPFYHIVPNLYNLKYSNNTEPEPRRCRRTDGKKWRCSRAAAPDRKYCDRHMHRTRPHSRKPVFEARKKTANPPGSNFPSESAADPNSTKPTSDFRKDNTFDTIYPPQYKNKLKLNYADLNEFCFPFPEELNSCDRRETAATVTTDDDVISPSLSISTLLGLSMSCNTTLGPQSSISGPLGEVLVSLSESSSSNSASFARSENVQVGE